ncbi:hypothetical protein BDY21DRAFT_349557 [Lineolata rhizophorae]|uniref:Uncharacterized protein n=1 Tax=Lineolata rhizophorae TaxID=578093 RepID=A0A6A6NVK8_9PEZI|nr:hypothetical protein BDY21DRAFT_349557 [Lineolata rhizophorae]
MNPRDVWLLHSLRGLDFSQSRFANPIPLRDIEVRSLKLHNGFHFVLAEERI